MPRDSHHRPNSRDSRQLLAHLIEARQQYSLFLSGVAQGQRPPDSAEKIQLKTNCDKALDAWRAAHEAWRLDASATVHTISKRRDN